jgi:Skp family chaperone for outer membrane proteins
MSDTPGGSGDQPVTSGTPSQEPIIPAAGDAPTPPAAPQWTPPPPPQWAPAPPQQWAPPPPPQPQWTPPQPQQWTPPRPLPHAPQWAPPPPQQWAPPPPPPAPVVDATQAPTPWTPPADATQQWAPPADGDATQPWTPPADATQQWAPPADGDATQPWTPPAPPTDGSQPWTPPADADATQPWTPPADATQPWTPPADATQPWTPPADATQPWTPPAPPTDGSQPWTPQPPAQYGGYMPPPPRKSATRFILPIFSFFLVIVLIGVSVFSYMTITSTQKNLDDTKHALTAETNKYNAEVAGRQADVAALSDCISSMKTDQIALSDLNAHMTEIEAARQAYEAQLLRALNDEHQAILDMLNAPTQSAFNSAVDLAVKGETEMNAASTLKTALDALISRYDLSSPASAASTLAAHVAATNTKCTAAIQGAATKPGSSSPVPTAAPSSH